MSARPEERLAALQGGVVAEFVFFWAPDPRDPAGCLSQWWPAPFVVDGVTYATAEHWMMATKARRFGDDDAVAEIWADPDPATAKAVGRRVRGFDSARWADVSYDAVVAGNLAKFGQHDDLRGYLLGTAPAVLVEASPADRIWGSGLGADDPAAREPARWPGANRLGFALMAVRERLSR